MYMMISWLSTNHELRVFGAIALGAALFVGSLAGAQQATPAQNSAPPQSAQPSLAKPASGQQTSRVQAAPKLATEEDAAYKSFYDLQPGQSAEQIKQGEAFLLKYPDSRYLQVIYSRLAQAYFAKQDFKRMEDDGAKALALSPNDVDVLASMGWAIPHSFNPDDPQDAARLQRAQDYAQRALQILPALNKPDAVSVEDFERARNERLSEAHSGLGLVDFRRAQYAQAVSEFQQAAKLADSPDPVDFFILGISLEQLQRYEEAAAVYDQCGRISNTFQTRCQAGALQARKEMAAHPAVAKP
jgi:tetratricopeptide (TPR) repeat protein